MRASHSEGCILAKHSPVTDIPTPPCLPITDVSDGASLNTTTFHRTATIGVTSKIDRCMFDLGPISGGPLNGQVYIIGLTFRPSVW